MQAQTNTATNSTGGGPFLIVGHRAAAVAAAKTGTGHRRRRATSANARSAAPMSARFGVLGERSGPGPVSTMTMENAPTNRPRAASNAAGWQRAKLRARRSVVRSAMTTTVRQRARGHVVLAR